MSLTNIRPVKRLEYFLQDIADGKKTATKTPVRRIEEFLRRIAVKVGNSGNTKQTLFLYPTKRTPDLSDLPQPPDGYRWVWNNQITALSADSKNGPALTYSQIYNNYYQRYKSGSIEIFINESFHTPAPTYTEYYSLVSRGEIQTGGLPSGGQTNAAVLFFSTNGEAFDLYGYSAQAEPES